MPENYTNDPPKFLIRNNGNQRFNPNLYNCGKVCLSLLGTWSGTGGEEWIPNKSTLFQVLNSIQSLILIEQPYFNEPGYEKGMGTPSGEQSNRKYNMNIRLYTMKHTINDLLENPKIYGDIEDIIINHFTLKKEHILEVCSKWVQEADDTAKTVYNDEFIRLKKNLDKLN